jgi:signal peptidase I
MKLKWFASRTTRLADDMSNHVEKILAAQRDILSGEAVQNVETALRETRDAIKSGANDETMKAQIVKLEASANLWLKPYPNAGIRENVEVLLVALTVAMAIRTFFAQPFKIPTGSMQPTLFGVTSENMRGEKPPSHPPPAWRRIYEACLYGVFYHYQVAEGDCEIADISPPQHFMRFINKNTVTMRYADGSYKPYTFWMTPEDHFTDYAGIEQGQQFHKGDEIVNFKETAGDHLFVDRLMYNFRKPKRGEIIVFETAGIGNGYAHLPPDQFYIKRMVAMGGDKVSIGDDRHLVINGVRLDKNTPHFENVYSFDPKLPVENAARPDSHYCGHLNQAVANASGFGQYNIAQLFPDQNTVYDVPPGHYMVMGDNTANSFDSRAWGDFSRTNVIGKYLFVYWPFTPRFGWSIK